VTECVRSGSEEGPQLKKGWDGFALENIVRGRAAGDFDTRGWRVTVVGEKGR
jgi:hypothetical protein